MSIRRVLLLVIIFTILSLGYTKQSLKIGSDEWAPFHSQESSINGEVEGFTADLVRAVLKKMNIVIEHHQIYPWKRALKMVFNGELDAVFTSTKTSEREYNCYFPSEPLTDFSYVFFIKKENRKRLKFNTLDDLKKYRIGIVSGFSYTKKFKEFIEEENNFDEVTTGDFNVKKLLASRIDYMVTPRRVGLDLMDKFDIKNECIMLEKPLNLDFLYIMFSKKTVSETFVIQFSDELKKFKQSKEYEGIIKRYKWR